MCDQSLASISFTVGSFWNHFTKHVKGLSCCDSRGTWNWGMGKRLPPETEIHISLFLRFSGDQYSIEDDEMWEEDIAQKQNTVFSTVYLPSGST